MDFFGCISKSYVQHTGFCCCKLIPFVCCEGSLPRQEQVCRRYSDSLRAGTGIESRWVRGYPHSSAPAVGPTVPPAQLLPGYSAGRRGVQHLHLTPRLKKEWNYTSTPPWAFMACSRVTFTFIFLPMKRWK